MKNRIQDLFEHKKALIAYITAGDPSLKETEKLIIELEKAGVDLIEIGLPFSDSIADGPVIQASHLRAIEAGTNLPKIIQMLRHIRRKTRIPIVVMGSFHLFYAYGVEQTLATLKDLQIDGIICPDLSIGIIIPVLKSALLYYIILVKNHNIKWRHLVSAISKWAMADVFAISIFVAFLGANAMEGTQATLQPGFYYFTGYVILSGIVAAVCRKMLLHKATNNA